MEKEEIEQLLAEYVSGSISVEKKEIIEKLINENSSLKSEAEAMLTVWRSLDENEEQLAVSVESDKQFYKMLETEKSKVTHVPVIQIKTSWIKIIAAVAACIAAFIIGRATVNPVEKVIYKTTYTKKSEAQPVVVKSETPVLVQKSQGSRKLKTKKQNVEEHSELALQLRSVYASERMSAILMLSNNAKLNPSELKLLGIALKEDPSPNIRFAIVNALRPMSKLPAVQEILIAALNHQNDALLQSSLVDMLIDAKSKQAVPQMLSLLEEQGTSSAVQLKIKEGIETFLY